MMQHERPSSASFRLAIMMFLQYAVWGAWLPYLASYLVAKPQDGGLGFTSGQVGWILGLAGSAGAVCGPFIAGQVADRILNAERALAILLLIGAALKYLTAFQTDFNSWLWLSMLYSIAYMPTLALTNSVAFANLDDPERKFPVVRSAGTWGWIVASSLFPLLWLNTDDHVINTSRIVDSLKLSAMISVGYALYCLVLLPKTPPKRSVEHPFAFAKAFALLRHPGFLVVTLVALPISMIHQAYFIRISPFLEHSVGIELKWIGTVLSLGQWSEMVFLAALALFIKRLGYRGVLALGTLAYMVRFAIFAVGEPTSLVVVAQALHGLCYGCFFAGAYLYVDRVAPSDVRHSAQTVFGIIILGLGPILASVYNQYFDRFQVNGAQSYVEFWWTQSAMALVSTVLLLLMFRPGVSGARADQVAETEAALAETAM